MQNTRLKSKLRAGTAMAVICAAGLLTPIPAYADCVIAADGVTVTCTGTDTDGFRSAVDNTIVTIEVSDVSAYETDLSLG